MYQSTLQNFQGPSINFQNRTIPFKPGIPFLEKSLPHGTIVTAKDFFGPPNVPENIVDYDSTTFWRAGTNHSWFELRFPEPENMSGLLIKAHSYNLSSFYKFRINGLVVEENPNDPNNPILTWIKDINTSYPYYVKNPEYDPRELSVFVRGGAYLQLHFDVHCSNGIQINDVSFM